MNAGAWTLPTLRSYTDVEWCEVGGSPLTLLAAETAPRHRWNVSPFRWATAAYPVMPLPAWARRRRSVAISCATGELVRSVAIAPSIARMASPWSALWGRPTWP